MKLNWKTLKIVFALVLIAGISYWAFTTLRPSVYSGTNLNFPIGHGVVSLNNPSSEPVTIQILGTGTRGFRVMNILDNTSVASTRVGSGSTGTQIFETSLPEGLSEFSVTGGTNISFLANSPSILEATIQNLNETEARAVMIFAALVIVGALFYIVRTTRDSWMPLIRPNTAETATLSPLIETAQGEAARSYGDNRKAR
jgi:hypothetical protein